MSARYETIGRWINKHGWRRGAEIGVFDGKTHLYLIKNTVIEYLIGVDVWGFNGFVEGPTKSGEKCYCQYCNETREGRLALATDHERFHFVMRETHKTRERSIIRRMTSEQASWLVNDGFLDFVFIDGDHSTEGVGADIDLWKPKLNRHGWLIGHDWNMASVRNAVNDRFRYPPEFEDDHIWYYK